MTDQDKMAEAFGLTASWPTQIHMWADILAEHNPGFNKQRFIRKAIAKWERHYEPAPIDDHIPY